MNKILVITTEPDAHVEMVRKHLPNDFGIDIFDPKKLALQTGLTLTEDGLMPGTKIGPVSVWYRKPRLLTHKEVQILGVPDDYVDAVVSMHKEGFAIINEAFTNSFWVSRPNNIFRAQNKLLQIMLAKEVGLTVPRTIFSSNPTAIERFRHAVGSIVMKPLGMPYAKVQDTPSWFYATAISSEDAMDYDGLELTPMIFQELVRKSSDLRITVIGNEVFGCKIVSKDMDWRRSQDSAETRYSPCAVNEGVSGACLKMLTKLGLNFGAFDFAQSDTGELVFLEINPNGQWGFVEEKTGLPLSQTMAKLLTKRL